MGWRFAAWLVLGLVAVLGVAPAGGQRADGKVGTEHPAKRLQYPSRKLKQVSPALTGKLEQVSPAAPGKLKQVSPAAAVRPRRDLESEQQRLQQTQKRLKDERERVAQARRREGSVLTEIEEVSRRLADKRREVAQLDSRIGRTQAEVTALHRDIARLEGQRALQEVLLSRRLQAIYKVQTQGGTVPVLLSSDDPVMRAMAVRHLTSLATLDARLIQGYRETSDELANRKGRGQERERELTDLRAAVREQQASVDREAARRRILLAKVRDERTYHERMVGDLTEASQRLEGLIRELQARQLQARQRQARVAPPKAPGPQAPGPQAPAPSAGAAPSTGGATPAGFRGRLSWPTSGKITAPFGAQVHPRFGTRTFRNGVDIEAAEGTGVDAVLAGQVVYAGWFKGYGNLIIVDHGDELFTLYAHVSEISVKEGDAVRQGQRIGAVGDTGSPAGPRLYFEVRYRGKPQDPEQWLRQRG